MTIFTYWRWEPHDGVPELLVSCDEFTMDSNPSWWVEECQKMRDAHPESEWRTIELSVPYDDVEAAFRATTADATVVQ